MNPIKKKARVAGFLYLLVAITAPIGLVYVPGRLIVSGDAVATAAHLRASELLLRIGIASELFHQAIFIFLVLALYSLFKSVNEPKARLMVILGALVSVPIVFLNVVNELAALILVGSSQFLSAFNQDQLDSLAYLFLRLHGQGITVAGIFWGLWLFPFGMLVIRSGFIPRALGFFLLIAGLGNLSGSFTSLLLPSYAHLVDPFVMISQWGELPIMVWLLIWGANILPPDADISPATGQR